jgi:hypothetical protein
VIAPVIPPQSPLQELIYGPQVTNRVVRTPDGDVVYGLCTVGDGGRVLDKHTVTGLDWRPGSRQELTRFDAGLLPARQLGSYAISGRRARPPLPSARAALIRRGPPCRESRGRTSTVVFYVAAVTVRRRSRLVASASPVSYTAETKLVARAPRPDEVPRMPAVPVEHYAEDLSARRSPRYSPDRDRDDHPDRHRRVLSFAHRTTVTRDHRRCPTRRVVAVRVHFRRARSVIGVNV